MTKKIAPRTATIVASALAVVSLSLLALSTVAFADVVQKNARNHQRALSAQIKAELAPEDSIPLRYLPVPPLPTPKPVAPAAPAVTQRQAAPIPSAQKPTTATGGPNAAPASVAQKAAAPVQQAAAWSVAECTRYVNSIRPAWAGSASIRCVGWRPDGFDGLTHSRVNSDDTGLSSILIYSGLGKTAYMRHILMHESAHIQGARPGAIAELQRTYGQWPYAGAYLSQPAEIFAESAARCAGGVGSDRGYALMNCASVNRVLAAAARGVVQSSYDDRPQTSPDGHIDVTEMPD